MADQSTPYSWTTNDDIVDLNAVTVSIEAAGKNAGATVFWADPPKFGANSPGGAQEFDNVPSALARAWEIVARGGFTRVVISIDDHRAWRDEWGELADAEGY